MAAHRSLSLLLVDDEDSYRKVLQREFERSGHQVQAARSAEDGLVLAERLQPDVVLLDLKMAGMGGIGFLREARARDLDAEVIILTGHPHLDSAVEALRHGAYDYLSKPVDLEHLRRTVERAGERKVLQRENRALRHALASRPASATLQSASPRMQEFLRRLPRVAESDCTVLLWGETGSGKEVIARELHRASPRAKEPLVVVDCASLAGSVRSRELFGHERGAFTGADRASPGLFEAADRGTVFLDEIGELDAEAQASLLRVLETSEIRRVGATRSQKLDVRVIAATHRDLAAEVEAGRFRQDLYFRLQVVQLDLPPLRERREDVLPLFESFLAARRPNGVAPALSSETRRVLLEYSWPGNVRELRNVAEMLAVIAPGPTIDVCDLPPRLLDRRHQVQSESPVQEEGQFLPIRELERRQILAVYDHCHQNKRRAAEILGISLRTLYNKLAEYEATHSS